MMAGKWAGETPNDAGRATKLFSEWSILRQCGENKSTI